MTTFQAQLIDVVPSHHPCAMYPMQPQHGHPEFFQLQQLGRESPAHQSTGSPMHSQSAPMCEAPPAPTRKRGAPPTPRVCKSEPIILTKSEWRKMRNRQSAARSREKSLERVRQLEARVLELQDENEQLIELLRALSQSAGITGESPLLRLSNPDTNAIKMRLLEGMIPPSNSSDCGSGNDEPPMNERWDAQDEFAFAV